ncbi:MAG: hypothetical protein GY950_16995 [bacterium]|nr:hypothetical protein [bacterium]
MEAYREIIAGNRLAEVIDLPEKLKSSEVEIIVLPVKDKDDRKDKNRSFKWEDIPEHNLGKELSPLDRDSIYSDER